MVHASVGPVPLLLGSPLSFVALAVTLAFGIQRTRSDRSETPDSGSMLVQWAVFVTVVVTLGTAVPVVATQL
jgi:succinate-acetate transporter protein